jgi:hypothetical protein
VSEVAWAIMVATSEAQRSCREKTNGRALGAAGIAFAGFGGNIAQAPQVGRRPQTANCGAFQGVFFGAHRYTPLCANLSTAFYRCSTGPSEFLSNTDGANSPKST